MTIGVDLSTDLQDWIRLSGMNMIQGSETNDGRTILGTRAVKSATLSTGSPDGMLLRHPIA